MNIFVDWLDQKFPAVCAKLECNDFEPLILMAAFTHPSLTNSPTALRLLDTAWNHTHNKRDEGMNNYERLEYFGDAVLNLSFADTLYWTYRTDTPGQLTLKRAAQVNKTVLAARFQKLGLDEFALLGKGVQLTENIRADMFEAVVGAFVHSMSSLYGESLTARLGFIQGLFYDAAESRKIV